MGIPVSCSPLLFLLLADYKYVGKCRRIIQVALGKEIHQGSITTPHGTFILRPLICPPRKKILRAPMINVVNVITERLVSSWYSVRGAGGALRHFTLSPAGEVCADQYVTRLISLYVLLISASSLSLPRCTECRRGLAMGILSVRLFVRL